MKATWGNKYTSAFKSQEDVALAMRVWLIQFHNKSTLTLRTALDQLALKLEWPPTVHEMMEQVKYLEQSAAPVPPSTAALPRMRNTEKAQKELAKMREILGVHKKET